MGIPMKQEMDEVLAARHGRAVQEKLARGRVAIAGLGGLGSTIAIALARAGVGHLHLMDFDRVDLTNLNRQQYGIADLGLLKTEALRAHIQAINPYLHIKSHSLRITDEAIPELFAEDEIICEAFDRPEEKAMLVNGLFDYYPEKWLVGASGMAGYGSSNAIVTRQVASHYYLCGDGHTDLGTPGGLMAPRVGICAAHQANMVIRLLLDEPSVY
ncbi:sulfur carrier protein ThiS adenylyltransferase [Eubacterium barkeri]|uniref:Sulfur carrier protein ThiS adenylyltransferase n=2 Tax=Eubacterium barkeri TaxID=1528 RepID=A0A1H3BSJ3_EUBBA|nr:sulfur carrier protein ThiS adenylyltransferase [Eubacterium barkeri]